MKIPLFVATLILSFLSLKAQVHGGVRIGTNYSDFNYDTAFAGSGLFGYNLGIFGYSDGQAFLKSGIDFHTIQSELQNSTGTGSVKHTFLSIPVLGGYRFYLDDEKFMGIRLAGGFSYGHILSIGDNRFDLSIADMNRSMFNLDFEIGLEIWLLTFDIYYLHGLSNVITSSTSKIRSVSVTVGARLF